MRVIFFFSLVQSFCSRRLVVSLSLSLSFFSLNVFGCSFLFMVNVGRNESYTRGFSVLSRGSFILLCLHRTRSLAVLYLFFCHGRTFSESVGWRSFVLTATARRWRHSYALTLIPFGKFLTRLFVDLFDGGRQCIMHWCVYALIFFFFFCCLFYTFETGFAYGRVLSYKIGTDGRCGFVLHLWDGVLFYRLRFGRRPASAWSISFPVHLRSPTLFIRFISIKKNQSLVYLWSYLW